MLVSKQFLRDFAYIANLYGWNADDVEDAKAQTRAHPELRAYWTELAEAHRAGYQQSRKNNYMRLGQWQQMQGAGDVSAFSLRIAGAREGEGCQSADLWPTSPAHACVRAEEGADAC